VIGSPGAFANDLVELPGRLMAMASLSGRSDGSWFQQGERAWFASWIPTCANGSQRWARLEHASLADDRRSNFHAPGSALQLACVA